MIIRIEKEKRRLTAEGFCMPIQLGFSPVGHKYAEGDGRTPEGRYYVCTKNANSKFFLSLGISYPNLSDAQIALEDQRITSQQFDAISTAQRQMRRPPWDTPLGGFVMIHGEHPEGRMGDWTAGCIALSNTSMEKLFSLAEIGDLVEILP